MTSKRAKPESWQQWAASNEHDSMRHAARINGVIKALAVAKAKGEPIGKMVACAVSGLDNDASWSVVAASCRNHADTLEKAQIKALAATRAETRQRRQSLAYTVSELAKAVAIQLTKGQTKPQAIMEVSKETSYSPSWVSACYETVKPAVLATIKGGQTKVV